MANVAQHDPAGGNGGPEPGAGSAPAPIRAWRWLRRGAGAAIARLLPAGPVQGARAWLRRRLYLDWRAVLDYPRADAEVGDGVLVHGWAVPPAQAVRLLCRALDAPARLAGRAHQAALDIGRQLSPTAIAVEALAGWLAPDQGEGSATRTVPNTLIGAPASTRT